MTGYGAFDIECSNWDEFVCAGIVDASGEARVYWSERAAFEAVCRYEGVLWTWAGGRYDLVWIASMAKMFGIRADARMSGGIVSLKIGLCTLRDGFKLYPVALAKAAAFAGVEKLSTGFDCVCGDDCGGYCAITRSLAPRQKRLLAEYLIGDVKATAAVVDSLHDFADEHGIALKSTVGASAWATLKAMGAPPAEWRSFRDYRYARLGYYGGRTEVYDTRILDVAHGCDINSAYPAALVSKAVPCGGYDRRSGAAAGAALRSGRPGVYSARVLVTPCHAPPLPNRGVGRLLFVTGEQSGTWTRDELLAAEERGHVIQAVTECIVWEREEKVAAPFMERFWGLRASFGKKSPQGGWLKWFVNSLTGKLAMRPEGERLVLNPDGDEIRSCPANATCLGVLCGRVKCCPHKCTGDCGKWEAIDRHATIWSAPTYSLSDCAHVQWAATLTGATRVELLSQLEHAGQDAIACDTDSVKARRPLTRRIGNELGEWSYEGKRVDWWSPFPKAYRSADAETGEYETRAKGVPHLDAIRFDRWARPGRDKRGRFTSDGRGVALDRGVWGVKGGARRGSVFERKDLTRHVRSDGKTVGSRAVLASGETRPLSWSEYRASLGKKESE